MNILFYIKKKQMIVLMILFSLCFLVGLYRNLLVSNLFSNKKDTTKKITASNFARSMKKGIYVLEIFSPIYYKSGGVRRKSAGVPFWVEQVEKCQKDPNILGLLLRINSPGGSMGASQEMYEALKRFKKSGKKLVVSIIDICASGAYYISLPADKIVANPGSLIGSIGVIMTTPNLSKLYEKWGVGFNVIKSKEDKDIFASYRDMTGEERNFLQSLVSEMHQQFLTEVVHWRSSHSSTNIIRKRASGLVYSASQSKAYGFIDEIGDFDKAKTILADLCGLEKKNLVIKNRKFNYEDFFYLFPSTDLFSSFFKKLSFDKQSFPLEYKLP